jgi:hypothetical protein
MIDRDRRRWTELSLAGLMAVVLWIGLRQHPSAFDDAYITYRYAWNIAQGRGFVYNVGEAVLGTTTPLYALLLAALSFIWPDIPVLSHTLGVLAWMMCVPLIYGIGRIGGREATGLIAAAFVAFSALFLTVLGMETPLYILLTLLTFFLHLSDHPIGAATSAGLTFICRWDGILVVGVFLFVEWLKRKDVFLRTTLACLGPIIVWLAYSQATFGSVFPNSFFAKAGQGWNPGLGGEEIGSFGRGLLRLASIAFSANGLFVVVPLFAAIGILSATRRRLVWWPLLAWTMFYIGGYIVLGVLRFTWYYPPIVPAVALASGEGIRVIARFATDRLHLKINQSALTIVLGAACLIPNADWLLQSRKTEMDAHSSSYVQVGEWLNANTPPGSSVALLEIGIVGFYSDRTVVDTMGLVSPAMVGHLGAWLQTLQFAVNHFWPDYIVALKQTAWEGIVHEPWLDEAYTLEAEIENSADPTAPMSIYHRRDGFPPDQFDIASTPDVRFDDKFALREFQILEDQVDPGNKLHAHLMWEAQADVKTDYRFRFDLWNVADGRRWTLADRLQPMRGGNPTTQWRAADVVIDAYTLNVPANVLPGFYLLQISAAKRGDPVKVLDLGGNAVGHIVAGPIRIGNAPEDTPAYPAPVTFADQLALTGYDLNYAPGDSALSVTLHWNATSDVLADYTAFVHLISASGELVAQHDAPPNLPTSVWPPRVAVLDTHLVSAPSELPSGRYEVRVGLYHWPDLTRLVVSYAGCRDASNQAVLLAYVTFGEAGSHDTTACPSVHPVPR